MGRCMGGPLVSGLLRFIGWLRPLWKTSPTAYRTLLVWTLKCKTPEGVTSRRPNAWQKSISSVSPRLYTTCARKWSFCFSRTLTRPGGFYCASTKARPSPGKLLAARNSKPKSASNFNRRSAKGPGSLTIGVSRIFTMDCKS
jgi:hypothetical protein